MDILHLVHQDGLQPKKVPVTKEEYYCTCPGCNGKDQFIIWDKLNWYHCRHCERRGDRIQYLRDFHNFSYKEACNYLGLDFTPESSRTQLWRPTSTFEPTTSITSIWAQKANRFINYCHAQLINNHSALQLLYERGFTLGTIQLFQLGWNPQAKWVQKSKWGIYDSTKKKLWFPRGLVIPIFDTDNNEPIRIKIWQKEDMHSKYVEIPGSKQSPAIFGTTSDRPIILLDSEFDAMLINQYAGDLCSCIVLEDTFNRPEYVCSTLLTSAPLLLFSLTTDDSIFQRWRTMYSKIFLWPSPECKSGVNLRRWILNAIYLHKNLNSDRPQ